MALPMAMDFESTPAGHGSSSLGSSVGSSVSAQDGLIDPKTASESASSLGERACDLLADSVHIFDLDLMNVVYVNRQAIEFFGLTLAEAQALGPGLISARIHPDDAPRLVDHLQNIDQLPSDQPFVIELRVKDDRGGWRWFSFREVVFQRRADGTIRQILATSQEVTDLKRTRQELAESENLFRLATEAMSGCVYDLDVAGDVIRRSPGVLQMVGIDPKAEIRNLGWWVDRLHEQDRGIFQTLFAEALRNTNQQHWEVEYRIRHENGDYIWVQDRARLVRDADGKLIRIVGQAVDVSSEKHARRQLGERERQYRTLISGLKEAVFQADTQNNLVLLNPAWEEITGYSVAESLGQSGMRIIHPEDQPLCTEWRRQLRNLEAEFCHGEVRCIRKDGSIRWIKLFARSTVDTAGLFAGVCGTIEDITERRTQQLALRQAKESAEAATLAKSHFIAQISHEIRTPLTAIMGYADLLVDRKLTEAQREDFAQTVRSNGEHLLAVLNDTLDLSKIEAGRMTVEQLPVDLPRLIEEIVSLNRKRAQSKSITFKLTLDSTVPTELEIDPTRVRQILLNLISNALKFTEAGVIELSLRCDPVRGPMQRLEGWMLRWIVSDTGIGMSQEQIDTLFKPFSQTDTSHARLFGGTGLGLTIGKRLARLLRGDLTVTSIAGEGSRFCLTIPAGVVPGARMVSDLCDLQSPAYAIESPLPKIAFPGRRVLLAEDSADIQKLVELCMLRAGIEIEIVDNGRAALAKVVGSMAGGSPFHLVIMDGQMPLMDGYETTRLLREQGFTNPILALTASAMSQDRERFLAAGATEFLGKPMRAAELIKAINRCLAGADGDARLTHIPAGPAEHSDDRTEAPHPEMRPRAGIESLLPVFIDDLEKKLSQLQGALQNSDFGVIAELAHQIKGSAGIYGFPTISHAAGSVVSAARRGETDWRIDRPLHRLIELCGRATRRRDALTETAADE